VHTEWMGKKYRHLQTFVSDMSLDTEYRDLFIPMYVGGACSNIACTIANKLK